MIWLVKIEAKQKCTVREKGVVKSSEVRRPCPDSYLQVFTRDKHWLFTLFLLLLPFWRANRRLIVNAVTGAHPSLISGNTKGRLVIGMLREAHFFLPQKMQTEGQL